MIGDTQGGGNPPPRSSSVTLTTWGTKPKGGSGLGHYLDTKLRGGNVGHASIAISIPADAAGQALIRKYCLSEGEPLIPFERVAQQSMNGRTGQVETHEVFNIYFSWWPQDGMRFALKQNVNMDGIAERPGVHVGRSDMINNEQRTYHGAIASSKKHLTTETIQHSQNILTPEQKNLLALEDQLELVENNIKELSLIDKKLQGDKKIKVTGALEQLLNKHFPSWKQEFGVRSVGLTRNMLSVENIAQLRQNIKEKTDENSKNKDAARKELFQVYQHLQRPSATDQIIDAQIAELQAKNKAAQNLTQLLPFDPKRKQEVLDILFEDKFKENGGIYDGASKAEIREALSRWRDFLPAEHKQITRTEFAFNDALVEQVLQNARKFRREFPALQKELDIEKKLQARTDPFLSAGYDRFVTKGLPPDDTITLPVGGLTSGERNMPGLNVEDMLKMARQITDNGEAFDLTSNNCSDTTGAILAAGAEDDLKPLLQKKMLGKYGNPQLVANGAMNYQTIVTSRKMEAIANAPPAFHETQISPAEQAPMPRAVNDYDDKGKEEYIAPERLPDLGMDDFLSIIPAPAAHVTPAAAAAPQSVAPAPPIPPLPPQIELLIKLKDQINLNRTADKAIISKTQHLQITAKSKDELKDIARALKEMGIVPKLQEGINKGQKQYRLRVSTEALNAAIEKEPRLKENISDIFQQKMDEQKARALVAPSAPTPSEEKKTSMLSRPQIDSAPAAAPIVQQAPATFTPAAQKAFSPRAPAVDRPTVPPMQQAPAAIRSAAQTPTIQQARPIEAAVPPEPAKGRPSALAFWEAKVAQGREQRRNDAANPPTHDIAANPTTLKRK